MLEGSFLLFSWERKIITGWGNWADPRSLPSPKKEPREEREKRKGTSIQIDLTYGDGGGSKDERENRLREERFNKGYTSFGTFLALVVHTCGASLSSRVAK